MIIFGSIAGIKFAKYLLLGLIDKVINRVSGDLGKSLSKLIVKRLLPLFYALAIQIAGKELTLTGTGRKVVDALLLPFIFVC